MTKPEAYLSATTILKDAGGELVGRTRLQKIGFLLQLAGFSDAFAFEYRHYGPYSEGLAQAMDTAVAFGLVKEEERIADWGGRYSIYRIEKAPDAEDDDRAAFVREAKEIDAVILELAATAAYLFAYEGIGNRVAGNPWMETQRRKPSKASNGRLELAVKAYAKLREIRTLNPLPVLPSLH